jgi:hypothetical protein
LLSLADILIETYFAESALLRTLKNINKLGSAESQKAMTKVYVFDATQTVLRKGNDIIGNITDTKEKTKLLKGMHQLCRYDDLPDVISLKNQIADMLIAENKYCF